MDYANITVLYAKNVYICHGFVITLEIVNSVDEDFSIS